MSRTRESDLRFNGNQIRQVSVPAVDLQSVTRIRLGGGLECAEVDGEVDRARVGPIEEGYQLEAGGILLAELGHQIRLDNAGGDDVFDDVDVAAGDVDPAQEVNLRSGLAVG